MVETEKYWLVGSRFSRSIVAFETVPCPREDEDGYIRGLVRKGMLCHMGNLATKNLWSIDIDF